MSFDESIVILGADNWALLMYSGLLELSVILTIIYAGMWKKSYGVYYTLLFAFIPVSNLGYVLLAFSSSVEAAMVALKIMYIGACFLIFFVTMAIFDLCHIRVPKWLVVVFFYLCAQMYFGVVMTEYTHIFYKNVRIEKAYGVTVLIKEYGPLHTVFIGMLIFLFAVSLLTILYALFFKKNVSNKRAIMLFFAELVTIVTFFGGKILSLPLDMTPVAYVFVQIIFLIIIRRIAILNIRDMVIDSLTRLGDEGYISFDRRMRYIGCIGIASQVFPELQKIQVDRKATRNAFLVREFIPLIREYREHHSVQPVDVIRGETIYQISVKPLFFGKRIAGYQIQVVDDTWDRKQINMLDRFNDYLQEKVEEKTRGLQSMHDNLILSMATMVESRDNSTGGHIRRTSDCVRILIDEMKRDPTCEVAHNENFCRNLIKAAPMHDLGKIAVPDAILQKPGRFEDWEYEKMKEHAAEGARIVHEILKDLDHSQDKSNREFHVLAENVAHYHHERMDGSGYPEGLVGEAIPIEARIMAIADVYDALVSKRVYKERMSFEKADSIMMESFGKHFDPSLEKYYVAARPRLEQYYREQDEQETETAPKPAEDA